MTLPLCSLSALWLPPTLRSCSALSPAPLYSCPLPSLLCPRLTATALPHRVVAQCLVRWDVEVAEREWPYHPWIVGRQDELNKCLATGRYIARTVVVLDETSRRVRWDVRGSVG